MATRLAPVQILERRPLDPAALDRIVAARVKQTGSRPIVRAGHDARDRLQPSPVAVMLRQRRQQCLRIGMQRRLEDPGDLARLHHLSGVHDEYTSGGFGDNREIVRDEK